jgi:TonB family protein
MVFFLAPMCSGVMSSANIATQATSTQQRTDESRKLKSGEPPEYPALARRMRIFGVATVEATINPKGSVIQVTELGGNPVLVEALMRAVKKWTYEPSNKISTIQVRFEFKSTNE